MTDGPLLWYVNRGTGLVLLVLLTTTAVLGVLTATRTGARPDRGVPRFVTQSLHRSVALISVTLLIVHVVSAVADTFVDIRWWQALVPWGATYEPLWLALGTLSLDLMVIVVVTSLLRTRLPLGAWRWIHTGSYLAWILALVHAIGIGTDLKNANPTAVAIAAACAVAFILAVAWRLLWLAAGRLTPSRSAA
jgi:predicted ferric reductase